jgi:uncharacterized protein YbjQ (UPF0145 family)
MGLHLLYLMVGFQSLDPIWRQKIMATDILITEKRDLSVKREIGPVSVMEATEQTDAIVKLRERAIELGANAVVGLCISKAIGDPYFDASKVFVHGMAVEI